MIACPRCQHQNPADATFCQECGSRLEAPCPACGVTNELGAKFCKKCGQRVAQTGSAADAQRTRFDVPATYTPKHLAEKILTSKAALEGERKQVTVLFADLKGSMELLADRDPEEARKILDPVLERMMEAVHRYEGTVNQVMGDGIMALFGAPLAHEDHAVRACYAALRMQESVKVYADEVRRSHAAVVKIRVGLNSGEVVVRAIGSDLHMDYTAVGQTTHLAARMEQLADPGAIVITPETLALAEGYVEVKSLGPVPVKGLADPVEVYEVTGAGPGRTRLQAATRRGLTRFVGRDAELEQLRRAQQLAAAGHGQVAAIVGEAGVGKSRLVYELTHSHRLQGWRVLESASVSYGKATSYLPVIDLLKGYFKIQDRDDLREIREKVTGKLLTLDRALEPTLPALLALLDLPVDDESWQTLDPSERRQRTLDAVKRVLLREAREQPLLLIFEDLHWIDGETQALLDGLVDSLGSARLLLLVNYRPEYRHAWGSKTSYSQMRLDALAAENAGELLDALFGDDPGLAPLKQLLVKRGNPFFLEETVRTLVETNALAGDRGRYRLAQPIQAIQVPATVQAMLAARIDRLPSEDKRLLQVASVVGKDVPFTLLQAVAELQDGALRRGLDHLQVAEFLYETGLYPDLEYSFKHALTHDVAYGSMLQERRRTLHARVVAAIEALHADRLTEHVEQLAHHAYQGEVWNKAVAYLRQAGAKAFGRSASRDAVLHYERALEALSRCGETPGTISDGIDIRFELRTALLPLARFDAILRHLQDAERLARHLGDEKRLGWVGIYTTAHLWMTGRSSLARAHAEKTQSIAERGDDPGLRIVANNYVGIACLTSGDYLQACDAFLLVAETAKDAMLHERFGQAAVPAVLSRWGLALASGERGAFKDAVVHAQEGMRIAEPTNAYSRFLAFHALGCVNVMRGDLVQGVAALEQALAVCRDWNLGVLLPMACGAMGYGYLQGRDPARALTLLREACASYDSTGMGVFQSLAEVRLGEALLIAGQHGKASEAAVRGLTLARERGERGHEAHALRLLAEMGSTREPADEAPYHDAIALARELGMRPLVAHCHLGLGKLYQRTDRRQDAQEHLTTAITMYRDMDMRFWLEQAEAESRALA
jgi:class 3 adenylate cyclase/tetratricopeptide (TPR) repeat protein